MSSMSNKPLNLEVFTHPEKDKKKKKETMQRSRSYHGRGIIFELFTYFVDNFKSRV